jgi:hypothetical protein
MHIVLVLLLMLFACPAVAGTAGAVAAQSTSLDEGRFTLTRAGATVGSEAFSIRQSGTGDAARIIAQAQIRLESGSGTLEMAPALQASGADMAISAYQVKVSGEAAEEIYVTLGERRFLTTVVSEAGERQREYRASAGTVLLDRDVAHQFYFLGRRLESGATSFPVIIPREGRQLEMRVTESAIVTIRIGEQSLQARHVRLEGGGEIREAWIDDQHRVLRVADPGSGYRAERQEPPG